MINFFWLNKILPFTHISAAIQNKSLNRKATEVESKIPEITNLATKTTLYTKAIEIEKNTQRLKMKYYSDKHVLEKIIEDVDKKKPNTSGLVKNTDYKPKIKETENKIPTITGLVATAALNIKEYKGHKSLK